METVPSSDMPPAYCYVPMSDADQPLNVSLLISKEIDYDTKPVIDEVLSFGDKNSRVIFTFKVLSISLLQTIVVGLTMAIFLLCDMPYYNEDFVFPMLGISVALYLIIMAVMVHYDMKEQNKPRHNYAFLVLYGLAIGLIIYSPLGLYVHSYYYTYLLEMMIGAWICYFLAAVVVLISLIFTLNSKKEFGLVSSITIGTLVFVISYFGFFLPAMMYHIDPPFESFPGFYFALFLYIHFVYILNDIHKMTGSNYRIVMTPNDYVRGAVNLQIDYIIPIKDFCVPKCQ